MTQQKPSKRSGKLKPLKNDVIYIDHKTGLKICSFNECVEKFNKIEQEIVIRERRGEQVELMIQYHVCNQCGRKHRNAKDKIESWGSFLEVMAGNKPNFTIENKGEKHEQS
jgi:hypothetical protein